MRLSLASVAALAASAGASPLEPRDLTSNFQAAINAFECRAVNFLVNAGREAVSATAFCSSFLSVPIATKTSTAPAASVTSTQTATAPTFTVTATPHTLAFLYYQPTQTITSVVTTSVTQSATSSFVAPASTSVTTVTVSIRPTPVFTTTTTSTTTTTRFSVENPRTTYVFESLCAPKQKRAIRTAPCPTMWQAFASKALSIACACLSIPQSTTTAVTTATGTTTITTTTTPLATTTPTVTSTTTLDTLPTYTVFALTITETQTTTQLVTSTVTVSQISTETSTPIVYQTITAQEILPPSATVTTTTTTTTFTSITVAGAVQTQLVFDVLDQNLQYVAPDPNSPTFLLSAVPLRPATGWFLSPTGPLIWAASLTTPAYDTPY